MYTIYKLNANELNSSFLRSLKASFKNKDIEIAVCETSDSAQDETDYLLKSPENRARLLKALDDIKDPNKLITVNVDELA